MITNEFRHAVAQCWSSAWHPTERPQDVLDAKGNIVTYGMPTKMIPLTADELAHSFDVARRRVAFAAR